MPLLILFIIIPIIEIALFIQIGGLIGLWPTIGLILLSAVVGMMLIRSQGRRALADLQDSFRSMQDPTRPLAHGAMILLSGALMLTPGFFTDTVGLLLLVPGIRDWIMRRAGRRMTVTRSGFGFDDRTQPRHGWGGQRDGVIDGEYEVQDDLYPGRTYERRDDIDPTTYESGEVPRDELPRENPRRRRPSGWTRED